MEHTFNGVLYYPSPVGLLQLCADEEGLCGVHFVGTEAEPDTGTENELLRRTARELDEYFGGKRRDFDIPLSLHGTPFQRRVWEALLQIPYGETRSYAEVAAMAGSPKAFRAVGMANHNNPVSILVPCHRVINTGGGLGGYGGGLDVKRFLLQLEGLSL